MTLNAGRLGAMELDVLRQLDRRRALVWRLADPLPPYTYKQRAEIAQRLAKDRHLLRIERGVYLVLPRSGDRRPLPVELIGAWFAGEPHAIIGATAAKHHQLSVDVPSIVEVQLTRRKLPVTFQGQRYRFTAASAQSVQADNALVEYPSGPTSVASPAKIVVLLLKHERGRRDASARRDLRSAISVLERGHQRGIWGRTVNWERVIKHHGSTYAARRLGYLLETLGIQGADRLKPMIGTSAYARLDTTRPSEGPINKRWKVYVNDPLLMKGVVNADPHV